MKRRSVLFALFLLLPLGVVCVANGIRQDPGTRLQRDASGHALPLLENGSFEDADGVRVRGWRQVSFQRSEPSFAIDSLAHGGARSARIAAGDQGASAAWTAIVAVRPYSTYRVTAWIRTENVAGAGKGALLNINGVEPQQTRAIKGTQDWTEVELTFDSRSNDTVQVDCTLGGGGKVTGNAWFDDVAVAVVAERELKPAVSIDATATRAPMSKYIYGQFIEHLGRCIYGGIWAEMLEDRKFYYAVGDKESPWKTVGEPAAVTMSTERAFVGEHSPEIRLQADSTGVGRAAFPAPRKTASAAGIEQGDLALVKGKKYVGRVVLAGDKSAAPVRVSLVWGAGEAERQTVTVDRLASAYRTTPLEFSAPVTTAAGRLVIESAGRGVLRIGTASLMPSDNVEGFRPDTLQLLRELNAPVYRWPGGNFVSGYNWHDGIGERDRRPPRKNPAWTGVEHNDVGVHEFMAFCRLVNAEPYIAVNSGRGGAAEAADEVEYVNGAATTPMGRRRAVNGQADPWHCRFWSIGNEMYGDWQLGHMPLQDYVQKHNQFAAAMRAKSPGLELIGVGAVGEWSQAMLTNCSDNMSLMSEHFYCQDKPGLLSHVSQIPRQVRRIAEAHRKYRQAIPALKGKDIRIALDEWNYWYGPHLYGELGTQYFLKDALGIAAGLHEYSRQSDVIFMANYAQTVNVIGAIKTSKTAAVLDSTGMVLKMYRQHFGTIPVQLTGTPEPLDVAAAWTDDRRVLTIAIVNPTKTEQGVDLELAGVALPPSARAWRVAGTNELACNVPGNEVEVAIEEIVAAPFGKRLAVPAMSATIYEIRLTR